MHYHPKANVKILEYLRYPELQFLDNAVSYQTEEDQVGERLACGVISIVSNI